MGGRIRAVTMVLAVAMALSGGQCAQAGGLIEALATPAPAIAAVQGEFRMKLPPGFAPLDSEALTGYEAAVLRDYPNAAQTLLAAANGDRSAALLVAAIDSGADCLDAAREAAGALLEYSDAAREFHFGSNRCAGFGCAIGEQAYHLYFFSDGARVLLVAVSGLESEETERMLAGLRFG